MAHNRKQTADKLKKHVHETFEHVRKALELRERLLSRQIDVLLNATPRPNARSNGGRPLQLIDQLKFLPQNETSVLENIRRLGKFNVDNYKFYADPTFAIEDYICPNADHELMYKCLLNGNEEEPDESAATTPTPLSPDGSVVLDFNRASGAQREQIVQMTLSESKELIAKSFSRVELTQPQPDGIDNVTDEQRIARMLIENLNSDPQPQVQVVQQQQQQLPSETAEPVRRESKKAKRGKGKSAANGAGGTINMKNISSLTINTMCSRENSVKKSSKTTATGKQQTTAATQVEAAAPSNTTASTTPTPTPPPQKSTSEVIMETHSTMENTSSALLDSNGQSSEAVIDYGCEFYNRLVAEIRNSMKTSRNVAAAPPIEQLNLSASSQSPSSAASTTMSSAFLASPSLASSASPLSASSANQSSLVSPAPSEPALQHECSRMLFQNIRNLKITLPPASVAKIQGKRRSQQSGTGEAATTAQPVADEVQIEEWLKQIISEPELEPAAGLEILEHSLINGCDAVKAIGE